MAKDKEGIRNEEAADAAKPAEPKAAKEPKPAAGMSVLEQALKQAELTAWDVKRYVHEGEVVTILDTENKQHRVLVGKLYDPLVEVALAKHGVPRSKVRSVDRSPESIIIRTYVDGAREIVIPLPKKKA